jgi:putative PIN family toxin of toxin-antitoxin system
LARVFVLDTSVLISASLINGSIGRKAFVRALALGTIAASEETLGEFQSKLLNKKFDKYFGSRERLAAVEEVRQNSRLITGVVTIAACRDPDDDKFLSLADTVHADCIISHDKDLLIMNPFKGIPIVTPLQFLDMYPVVTTT